MKRALREKLDKVNYSWSSISFKEAQDISMEKVYLPKEVDNIESLLNVNFEDTISY